MQVNDPYQNQNRKNMLWLGGGVGLLLIVSVLGFTAGFLQMFGQSGGSPVRVQGTAPEPPPLLDTGSVPETMTREDAKSMPKDVYDWLKHLERIEAKVSRKERSETFGLTNSMGSIIAGIHEKTAEGEDPGFSDDAVTSKVDERSEEEWREILADFRSLPPPSECRDLAMTYESHLVELPNYFHELQTIFANIGSGSDGQSLDRLQEILTEHEERIDQPRQESNKKKDEICAKYDTRPWFVIKSDPSNGLGEKLGGLLPGGSLGGLPKF